MSELICPRQQMPRPPPPLLLLGYKCPRVRSVVMLKHRAQDNNAPETSCVAAINYDAYLTHSRT